MARSGGVGLGRKARLLSSAFTLALLASCTPFPTLPTDPPETEVRVATYNTAHFGDHSASAPDGDKVAEVRGDIQRVGQSLGMEAWLFQELYRSLTPNPNPFVTDHVARILEVLPGFQAVFYEENDADGEFSKGNGVFWDTAQLDPVGTPIQMNFRDTGAFTDLKGGVGQILRRRSDGREVLVASVHYDAGLSSLSRLQQGEQTVELLTAGVLARAALISVPPEELPWIFGGDLNTAGGDTEQVLAYFEQTEGFVPWWSYCVKTFNVGFCLDHIYLKGLVPLGGTVDYEAEGSDHFPVVASIDLP